MTTELKNCDVCGRSTHTLSVCTCGDVTRCADYMDRHSCALAHSCETWSAELERIYGPTKRKDRAGNDVATTAQLVHRGRRTPAGLHLREV